jgi:hypothetical protein
MRGVGGCCRDTGRTRGRRGRRAQGAAAGFAALALAGGLPAVGATVDGSVRLSWFQTDLGEAESSGSDHSATLSLQQELSPYLRLRFSGLYGEQASSYDGREVQSREVTQPTADLAYSRPNLSWRIGWENLVVDGREQAQRFESNALRASLSWRPRGGFRLGLSYREATNQSEDVAALGRDLETRQGRVDAVLQRRHWSVGYGASYNELAGGASGLEIEQLRQDLRLLASRGFAGDRLTVTLSGTAGRLDSEQRAGAGELGDPLPATAGLYAVDASPAIGELDPAPGLIDGDVASAASPPIEIGGANTFRNVGLDLGGPRPATRLEIVVDRVSGSQVVWEVYESADGLVWDPVAGVSRSFDTDLLRYTLRFPETSQRYLKAVNVSSNSENNVRVTELRALLDYSTGAAPPERSSDVYRASVSLGWRAGERVRLDAGGYSSNDSTTVGGVVRRDDTASGHHAGARVQLAQDLVLSLSYRHGESEQRRGEVLTRKSDDLGATLRWTPLPTVDALASAGLRSDADATRDLSETEYARFMVSLDLLDELRLVTDLGASRLQGAAVRTARDTLTFHQRIEMRPRKYWRVHGGYSWSRIDAGGGQSIYESQSMYVDFGWTPGSALTLTGALSYFDESVGSTLRQSYGLSWSPGPRFSLSLGWDQYEQRDGLLTGNDSLAIQYQLGARMQLFASLSRSRSDLGTGAGEEIASAYAGTTISF